MTDDYGPFSLQSDEPMLNIKAVSQATGIDPVTLRAWERRYGVPSPERADQGYRLYSERDIAILQWLKAKTDAGVAIKQAIAMLRSQNPQSHIEQPGEPSLIIATNPTATLEELYQKLMAASREFDTVTAQQLIKQAFALFPLEEVCLSLLLPLLHEIGQAWERGEISLQVEHFTTHLVRQQLLAFGATMSPPWRDGRVVAGCAPNDWHEVGILILSLFLRRRGWEVIYLGQAVGLDRLGEAIETISPRVVLLTSGHLETATHLLEAAELVSGIARQHTNLSFLYAGTLFKNTPQLVGLFPGVFAGSTLLDGLDTINGILAGSLDPEPAEGFVASADVLEVYSMVNAVSLTLMDGLRNLLHASQAELAEEAISLRATQQVNALLAGLRFGLPELVEAESNPARNFLSKNGVGLDSLLALFEPYVGSTLLPALEPYLEKF